MKTVVFACRPMKKTFWNYLHHIHQVDQRLTSLRLKIFFYKDFQLPFKSATPLFPFLTGQVYTFVSPATLIIFAFYLSDNPVNAALRLLDEGQEICDVAMVVGMNVYRSTLY